MLTLTWAQCRVLPVSYQETLKSSAVECYSCPNFHIPLLNSLPRPNLLTSSYPEYSLSTSSVQDMIYLAKGDPLTLFYCPRNRLNRRATNHFLFSHDSNLDSLYLPRKSIGGHKDPSPMHCHDISFYSGNVRENFICNILIWLPYNIYQRDFG